MHKFIIPALALAAFIWLAHHSLNAQHGYRQSEADALAALTEAAVAEDDWLSQLQRASRL